MQALTYIKTYLCDLYKSINIIIFSMIFFVFNKTPIENLHQILNQHINWILSLIYVGLFVLGAAIILLIKKYHFFNHKLITIPIESFLGMAHVSYGVLLGFSMAYIWGHTESIEEFFISIPKLWFLYTGLFVVQMILVGNKKFKSVSLIEYHNQI